MWKRAALIACVAACASPPDTTEIQSSVASTCPASWCGGNSPEIAHLGFWELNLDHVADDQGFAVLGMSRTDPSSGRAQFFDLDVRGSAIAAMDTHGRKPITGTGLVGFTIWLSQGREQYGLIISEVHSVPEAVPHGSGFDSLATYLLRWSTVADRRLPGVVAAGTVLEPPILDPNNPPMPVCPDDVPWTVDPSWDESASMARFNAVVFEGDRFDATARTVSPTADNRWFNLGCARHTLAKMRLTRNTLSTVVTKDWRDVQATLKMLSADYCGDGQAFTVTGTPLLWQESTPEMMTYWQTPEPWALEARWDETGASCFDAPRLIAHPSTQFPPSRFTPYSDITAYLIGACGLSRCTNLDPMASDGHRITSANWSPPPTP